MEVTSQEVNTTTLVQFLNEDVCISRNAHTLEKNINSTIFHSLIGEE